MSTTGDAGRLPSIATTNISLRAIVDADKRLDELSTARVIGEAAEAIHKLQKNGQPLGTLAPLAIVVSSAGVRVDPQVSPTTAYVAPERLRGQPGDRRSDVFSLGAMLWEALAHAPLFDGGSDDATKQAVFEKDVRPPSELNANVPAELDAICKKALARDPADRYQSTKVMAAEISAVLDDASYADNNDQIAKYLEETFPAGAPTPTTPSAGADLAAKLAATPAGSAPATKASLKETTLGIAPIKEVEAAPEEPKPESTMKFGAAPVTPATTEPVPTPTPTTPTPPPASATPTESAAPAPVPATPSAPIVAGAAPAGKRHTGPKPAVSISTAETVQTPALVPTALPSKPTDTPTSSKVAGLPSMPPGASIADADTQREPILKDIKPSDTVPDAAPPAKAEPAPRPSQPAVDPRDAVSLPAIPGRRAKSETGEMLGGWGWTEGQDAGDGGYEDDVDEEQVRRKRLIMAIGGALGVLGLIIVIALAAGGGGDKKATDAKQPVAEGPSRTAPEPTFAPLPDPAPTPAPAPEPLASVDPAAIEPAEGSAVVDPAVAKAEALAAENAAKAEAERLAKEQAERDKAAKAEEARLAKEAADQQKAAKAEELRLAKEQTAKDKAAKAEEVRLAKEAAAKQAAEARLAKEAAAKQKAEEARLAKAAQPKPAPPAAKPEPKKTEKKTVKSGPKPVDPYAETAKVDPAGAYKLGFQQYVRGDTSGALSTFKGSQAANPGYAPTYRGLGLVYEKMGNKDAAKTAFRRYLQLSPKAADAEQIRQRMEKL